MTAILDRVPLDRINAEAERINWGRLTLLLIGGVLYGVGWLASKAWRFIRAVFVVIGVVVAWSVAAMKVGWQDAREPTVRGTA